jgi:hypothetical protein
MGKFEFKTSVLIGITILIAIIIAIIELLIKGDLDGTLLLILSFFVAPIQGTVAVVAAAEVTKGKWIDPLKKDLLAFYPLIAFCALLFLVFGLQLDIYPWTEIEHKWLNKPFFVLRNVVLFLISYLFAQRFAKASLQNSESKGRWALLYLFSFVITQSLVAFDWVMSLEFPWVSTLFGGIFFMEAFYTGLALLGIIAAYSIIRNSDKDGIVIKVMKDSATFMFGFALAWAGLFFAQYLVIWYGNIPHETAFFTKRMDHTFYSKLLWIHFFMLFVIPFIGLMASKIKLLPWWVLGLSNIVLLGVLVERIYYILPVTSINIACWIIEFLLVEFLLLIFFISRNNFLLSSRD